MSWQAFGPQEGRGEGKHALAQVVPDVSGECKQLLRALCQNVCVSRAHGNLISSAHIHRVWLDHPALHKKEARTQVSWAHFIQAWPRLIELPELWPCTC